MLYRRFRIHDDSVIGLSCCVPFAPEVWLNHYEIGTKSPQVGRTTHDYYSHVPSLLYRQEEIKFCFKIKITKPGNCFQCALKFPFLLGQASKLLSGFRGQNITRCSSQLFQLISIAQLRSTVLPRQLIGLDLMSPNWLVAHKWTRLIFLYPRTS